MQTDFSPITIGSRESALAQVQAQGVITQLITHWGDQIAHPVLETFTTSGDIMLQAKLADIGGDKGLFVKELEQALLAQQIDLAVHSLKDMPGHCPEGLTLLAWGPREDARDALVSKIPGLTLDTLAPGSVIGTSSLRRIAQLRLKRPDCRFENIRGNLNSRLRKLDDPEGPYDALILAAAGLKRLGLSERIHESLDPLTLCIPAPGQGILAVQYRTGDSRVEALLTPLRDPVVQAISTAERAVMLALGLGCHSPMGAYALPDPEAPNRLLLRSVVFAEDGTQPQTVCQSFAIGPGLQAAITDYYQAMKSSK